MCHSSLRNYWHKWPAVTFDCTVHSAPRPWIWRRRHGCQCSQCISRNVHSTSVEMLQCISASHAHTSTLHQLQFHPVSEPKPRASGVTVNFEFCQGSMPSLLALARNLDSTSKLQIRRQILDVRQFLSLNQKILLRAKPRHLRFPFRYLQFDGCNVHLGNCRNAVSTLPLVEGPLQLQHTRDFTYQKIGTLRYLGFKSTNSWEQLG